MTPDSTVTAPPIQAVVVLYEVAPESSAALTGLLAALAADLAAANAVRVLVYDNSPQAHTWQAPPNISAVYVHDATNGGLLAAYRRALADAQRNGAPWLLLLDDDTQVPGEFVQMQLQLTAELAAKPDIAAVVPRLRSGGVVRSPHAPIGWRQSALPLDRDGPAPVGVTAFNSGAMLRRSAIEAVGGFPNHYPLDFLDHAMFARLAHAGYRLWVLPITLEHPMTWDDPRGAMGFERFVRVLAAEQRFHREYGGIEGALAFRLRCGLRAWRYRKWQDKRFAEACWRMAKG
jgi:GT2 family glycosyltransferase